MQQFVTLNLFYQYPTFQRNKMVTTVSFGDRDEDHSVSTSPPHEVSNNLSGEIIISHDHLYRWRRQPTTIPRHIGIGGAGFEDECCNVEIVWRLTVKDRRDHTK